MAGIRTRVLIGWLPEQACKYDLWVTRRVIDLMFSLGLSSFLREKLLQRLEKEAARY